MRNFQSNLQAWKLELLFFVSTLCQHLPVNCIILDSIDRNLKCRCICACSKHVHNGGFTLGFKFKKLGVQNTPQLDDAFELQDWTPKLEELFLQIRSIFLSGHEIWWATLTTLHFADLELES